MGEDYLAVAAERMKRRAHECATADVYAIQRRSLQIIERVCHPGIPPRSIESYHPRGRNMDGAIHIHHEPKAVPSHPQHLGVVGIDRPDRAVLVIHGDMVELTLTLRQPPHATVSHRILVSLAGRRWNERVVTEAATTRGRMTRAVVRQSARHCLRPADQTHDQSSDAAHQHLTHNPPPLLCSALACDNVSI